MIKKKITKNFIAVDKVIMYSFNYDYNFIENAFNGYMAEHLRTKFSNYCKKLGNSQTAFMYLYTELSSDNRQTLINYILTNKN
jgi:hypothetical protein